MTKILTPLVLEYIDDRYVRLVMPFGFYSTVLKRPVFAPIGFVCDLESVPGIRGTSPRGGVAHDYTCRVDSVPRITKKQAAAVYREVSGYLYQQRAKGKPGKSWGFIKAWAKWAVVRVAPRYFHKHKVMASYEDVAGF